MAIQTDYSTPAASLGRRAHSHCETLSLAADLVYKVWRSHSSLTALTETIRWTPIKIRMESGGLHASKLKESSRFFSVEAVALPNLTQTFRGRERSKRGYAVYVLVVSSTTPTLGALVLDRLVTLAPPTVHA